MALGNQPFQAQGQYAHRRAYSTNASPTAPREKKTGEKHQSEVDTNENDQEPTRKQVLLQRATESLCFTGNG